MTTNSQPGEVYASLHRQMVDLIRGWSKDANERQIIVAEALLKEVTVAGRKIADPDQRFALTNLALNLGDKVFDATGVYPLVRLDDPDQGLPYSTNIVIKGDLHGDVIVGETDVRLKELAYLDGLISKYRFWQTNYTPLAGVVEVRTAAVESGLALPTLFIPAGFEKLEKRRFGGERQIEWEPVDDLSEAFSRYGRLVLLGEPGSGKTTTLWRLTYDYAQTAKNDPQAPIPLFVPLGNCTRSENLFAYVQSCFEELGPLLPNYLRQSRAILLLDALNEMPENDHDERVDRVHALLNQYPSTPVVVSCRTLDYSEANPLQIERIRIRPLNPQQQSAFLRRYLGRYEGNWLYRRLVGGEAQGEQNGELSTWLELGRNPYFLMMLAQVSIAQASIPRNRGELCAAFVDTLLGREARRHGPSIWTGPEPIRNALAVLAHSMLASDTPVLTKSTLDSEMKFSKSLTWDQVTYLGASASLLETEDQKIRFTHRVLKEYFAALVIADKLDRGDDLEEYLSGEWTQPNPWEGTFITLAGMLPDMTPLIERLLVANPPLAARCVAESGGQRPAEATVRAVQQRLVELMTDPRVAISERDAAGVAVNHLGDPRRGVGLRADGLPDIEWVFVPERDPQSGRKEFIYGDKGERRTEADFWIARYPITYRQFQAFLDAADGFRNPLWWEGLAASPEHRRDAGEQRFRYWNHPRENVSWYDAVAFCRWLTEKAREHPDLLPAEPDRGRDWTITLPTKWQWEKAARGHDGRQYPWGGDQYKSGYANINETQNKAGPHNLQKTSAVGAYPQDVSPYGVADLSGNVEEWCLNSPISPISIVDCDLTRGGMRILQGGSWSSDSDWAVINRYNWNPSYARINYYGFRVVVVGWRANA